MWYTLSCQFIKNDPVQFTSLAINLSFTKVIIFSICLNKYTWCRQPQLLT